MAIDRINGVIELRIRLTIALENKDKNQEKKIKAMLKLKTNILFTSLVFVSNVGAKNHSDFVFCLRPCV